MESAFGADLGGVRVHTGPEVDRLSRALGARAFTSGAGIFFTEGSYRPGSADGDRLLAHELAHTIQPTAMVPRTVQRNVAVASFLATRAPVVQRTHHTPDARAASEMEAERKFTKLKKAMAEFEKRAEVSEDNLGAIENCGWDAGPGQCAPLRAALEAGFRASGRLSTAIYKWQTADRLDKKEAYDAAVKASAVFFARAGAVDDGITRLLKGLNGWLTDDVAATMRNQFPERHKGLWWALTVMNGLAVAISTACGLVSLFGWPPAAWIGGAVSLIALTIDKVVRAQVTGEEAREEGVVREYASKSYELQGKTLSQKVAGGVAKTLESRPWLSDAISLGIEAGGQAVNATGMGMLGSASLAFPEDVKTGVTTNWEAITTLKEGTDLATAGGVLFGVGFVVNLGNFVCTVHDDWREGVLKDKPLTAEQLENLERVLDLLFPGKTTKQHVAIDFAPAGAIIKHGSLPPALMTWTGKLDKKPPPESIYRKPPPTSIYGPVGQPGRRASKLF